MKIRTKLAKLQMHENLHKNVNENIHVFPSFHDFLRAIKATNMLQLHTATFLYVFYLSIKNGGPVLLDCIKFSQF